MITVKWDSQVSNAHRETSMPHLQMRGSVNTDILLAHEKPNEETYMHPSYYPGASAVPGKHGTQKTNISQGNW